MRTFNRGRVAAVVGAATVLALGIDSASYAATGWSLILGRVNQANSVTTIARTTAGPALALTVQNPTSAPFTTNGQGKVPNLYADRAAIADNATLIGGLTVAQI